MIYLVTPREPRARLDPGLLTSAVGLLFEIPGRGKLPDSKMGRGQQREGRREGGREGVPVQYSTLFYLL